ncbi:retrovirus-related pol polyprotein from transposon TNT 1-94 [Tanacetum coccineum]
MYTASLKRSENYKARPYQYASPSKQILKAKAKPFPPCIHYGFNDHRPDDSRNYTECEIYRSYDHFTSRHNCVIHIRGGVLAESSQFSESSIGVKCNTCGSIVHSTTNHNEFDHFKRGEKIQAIKAKEPTKKWVYKIKNFQNFSSPYTPKENGVAERKNRTLIEADRTMLNGLVLLKNLRTKAPHIPHTKDAGGPLNLINTEGTHEQNVQDEQIITQSTKGLSGQYTKISVSIIESSVLDVSQSYISNQASTSSHPVTQDRWSKDQHNKVVNIIGDPSEGMLTRSMAAKLTDALASKCLFADFLSKIKPKRVSEALKHSG